MTAAVRKAFSSVVQFLRRETVAHRQAAVKEQAIPRVGDYYADYSEPTRAQIDAADAELNKLFKNSKLVSEKREL
jgi:hypothetical protein